jgi:hypothetical protein
MKFNIDCGEKEEPKANIYLSCPRDDTYVLLHIDEYVVLKIDSSGFLRRWTLGDDAIDDLKKIGFQIDDLDKVIVI